MWNLPSSGTEPPSPALAGGVPPTEPPGKSQESILHMLADRKPILMLANHNSFSSLMINFLAWRKNIHGICPGILRFKGILWTWVWVNSGSWWCTGRPGVLQSMGSQRVRHNWVTELNWPEAKIRVLGSDGRCGDLFRYSHGLNSHQSGACRLPFVVL